MRRYDNSKPESTERVTFRFATDYRSRFHTENDLGRVDIEGDLYRGPYGVDLVVHHELNAALSKGGKLEFTDRFTVSERTTGYAVARPVASPQHALAQAISNLKTAGKAKVTKALNEARLVCAIRDLYETEGTKP